MFQSSRALAAFVAFGVAASAPATVTSITGALDPVTNTVAYAGGTFTEVLPFGGAGKPGVYGVEVRGGDSGRAATWEIGVGPGTSQAGYFNQANKEWVSGATSHAWSLTWTATGISFTIDNDAPLTWLTSGTPAGLTGNALKIYVKAIGTAGTASATVAAVDGTSLAQTLATNSETLFWSNDNFGGDGFTANGTLSLTPGGNSRYEVMFKHGIFVPATVPEPASWATMIAGFALIGGAARRRRGAACPPAAV